MTVAFDAGVVICAAVADQRGAILLDAIDASSPDVPVGIGSTLLFTEALTVADDRRDERLRMIAILGRLALLPVTQDVAVVAAALKLRHRLKTPDALHLATAITAGADQFVTINRRDFGSRITEIDIVHP
ncbi:PIN domain-containing protein [Mumia sp. zg.B17]|uniref:type II toxin-antitoxin system VapC family toxin n=1 Tax=unclassified Mumia TaxID=2621872 RepID=UPI001C6E3DB1|nr:MULTISPECIES: PIN domain-containing protein [unclassified Mumia]MBW9205327.1 PIN domain-containing protein [Mumia sp. zg.B17]MBW9208674.1 PIN domain-containing protein [Mumia sp. zg.B21]